MTGEAWHGTRGGYTSHACRCDACREAERAYYRANQAEIAEKQRAYREANRGVIAARRAGHEPCRRCGEVARLDAAGLCYFCQHGIAA